MSSLLLLVKFFADSARSQMRTEDRAGCLVERLILPGLSSVARQMIDWRDTAVALYTADTTNMMLTFG